MLMKTRHIDFNFVEERQRQIHSRLENWGRWCNGVPPRYVSPMFRLYRGDAKYVREPSGLLDGEVNLMDAAKMAKAVAALPAPHRAALQWCYVKPVNPRKIAASLGTSMEGLALFLRDGRQMLINRGV